MNSKEFSDLEDELEANEQDAKRYRWLRSVLSTGEWSRLGHYADRELDKQIDAAIAKATS